MYLVSIAYIYTVYKQGMFVISAEMQWNSLHTFITEVVSITMSLYVHSVQIELLSYCEIRTKYFGLHQVSSTELLEQNTAYTIQISHVECNLN